MCGIFGVLVGLDDPQLDRDFVRATVVSLLRFSETRGREAAGLVVHNRERIEVLKQAGSVSEFLEDPRLRAMLDRALAQSSRAHPALAIAGHSRLVTNGAQSNGDNNQPVIAGRAVTLHNGIVVNDRKLLERYPQLSAKGEVDTEVLAELLRLKLDQRGDLVSAARETFAEIEGSASIMMMFEDLDWVLLATNTGSLFQLRNRRGTLTAFASERFILQKLVDSKGFTERVGPCELTQIKAGTGVAIELDGLTARPFELTKATVGDEPVAPNGHRLEMIDFSSRADRLKRCVRCVLPETYPFVDFDEAGVCAYCRTWKVITPKGSDSLFEAVEQYRSKDGSPDVIVAFSGGRDSSYGLHYVKNVLGMNPVAFTYDWGMVTDLARRNQARVCGKLGVEHIIRSADISAKRRYVRKNVEAWLKKPELGMVTLFMAGDKEFYAHARQLRKETGIKLVIFCNGNEIENAPYKVGLCGIREDDHGATLTGMSLRNRTSLLWYFAKNYLKNPAYLNESLVDTANAFYQTFMVKDDFLYLFHYLPWREDVILDTIRAEYDWEIASDTSTTWRIGDGTAPFYNYIYHTIAGFTEDEVMLSNMVREGHLDRDEAMRRAIDYAKPRWPSIREYAQLIGFSAEEALQIINAAPKLY